MTCQNCDIQFAIWQIHMTLSESHVTFDVALLEIRIRMHHDNVMISDLGVHGRIVAHVVPPPLCMGTSLLLKKYMLEYPDRGSKKKTRVSCRSRTPQTRFCRSG